MSDVQNEVQEAAAEREDVAPARRAAALTQQEALGARAGGETRQKLWDRHLEVTEELDGYAVYTGCEGDSPDFCAFFADREFAERFIALRDPEDPECALLCDPAIALARITPQGLVVSNDYAIESHEQLRERVEQALAVAAPAEYPQQRSWQGERADVVAECERTERLSSVEGQLAVMALRVRIQRGEHERWYGTRHTADEDAQLLSTLRANPVRDVALRSLQEAAGRSSDEFASYLQALVVLLKGRA